MPSTCLESFASPCTRLALVSAVLLNLAILSQAQSATPPVPQKPPTVRSTEDSGARHEGVTVHGHWTIDVKNPDGKLVTHTEFENALVVPGGAQNLTQLLLGEQVPGGYEITLESGTATGNGPCAPFPSATGGQCFLLGSLLSPTPGTFQDTHTRCGGSAAPNQITATGPCYPLKVSAPSGLTSAGFTVNGTATASTTTSITDVYLQEVNCFKDGIGGGNTSPNSCAQTTGSAVSLTHATLPTPVPITAVGQMIAVTVQLSFE
jgi:hypothetical protein